MQTIEFTYEFQPVAPDSDYFELLVDAEIEDYRPMIAPSLNDPGAPAEGGGAIITSARDAQGNEMDLNTHAWVRYGPTPGSAITCPLGDILEEIAIDEAREQGI
jgi:hypothetical protein